MFYNMKTACCMPIWLSECINADRKLYCLIFIEMRMLIYLLLILVLKD